MKNYLQLLAIGIIGLFYIQTIQAQSTQTCITKSAFAADECGETCVGCQMNGYTGSTNGFSSGGGVFCNGDIVEENSVWHAFVAGTNTIGIEVDNFNCTQGDGLQIAIFDQCGGTALVCNAGMANGASSSKQLVYNNFVPGNTYYLVVDGYNSDDCDYTITVFNGFCIEPTLGAIGPISGPGTVCPGAYIGYTTPEVSNALFYEWTAPAGAIIVGYGQNQALIPANEGNAVEINFPVQAGNFQLKVRALGPCDQTTATFTKNINIAPIPPTTLPILFLSPNDLPYEWPYDPGSGIQSPGTYNFLTYLSSWLDCDSLIHQTIIVAAQPSGTVFWDFNNNNTFNPAVDLPAEGVTLIGSDGQVIQTDAEGQYVFEPMIPGSTISINGLPNFTLGVLPSVYTVQNNFIPYNFALKPQKGPANGHVYIDNNQNSQFDASDTPITTGSIVTSSGLQTVPDANGFFMLSNVSYPERIQLTNLPTELENVGSSELTYIPSVTTNYDFIVRYKAAYGSVYWDVDGNNTIGASDIAASGIAVMASGGGGSVFSDNMGQYNITGAFAGDTIRAIYPGAISIPAFYITQANTPQGGYPFLLVAQNTTQDISVDITNNTVFRPGFSTIMTVTVHNPHHTVVPDVSVGFSFPGFLEILNISGSPVWAGQDSIHWQIGTMTPFQTRSFTVKLRTPINTALGALLLFDAVAYPIAGDSQPANNTDHIAIHVVGAYDPNDKQVLPEFATPEMLDAHTPLDYTIRFQNTGNYVADWVELIDTLSSDLDWNSFRMVSASHKCTWGISAEGVLKVQFPNIFLPDSVSDEPGSHGFFKFAIFPYPGLNIGDDLSNFCDIYFDFNPPIRTNTAQLQVVYFLPDNMPGNSGKLLSARPNPASFGINFSWPIPTPEEGLLTLYNVMGVPVSTVVIDSGEFSAFFDTGSLSDGLYLAVLESGHLLYYKQVVIAKEGPIRRGAKG